MIFKPPIGDGKFN